MYFEDFYPGQTFEPLRRYRITGGEIVIFWANETGAQGLALSPNRCDDWQTA
jgi:acyl dehydratase